MSNISVHPFEPDLLTFSQVYNEFSKYTDASSPRDIFNRITEAMVTLFPEDPRMINGTKRFAFALNTLDNKFGFIGVQSLRSGKEMTDYELLNNSVKLFDGSGGDFGFQRHVGNIFFYDDTNTSRFNAFIFVTPYELTNNPDAQNYGFHRQIDKLENCIYLDKTGI